MGQHLLRYTVITGAVVIPVVVLYLDSFLTLLILLLLIICFNQEPPTPGSASDLIGNVHVSLSVVLDSGAADESVDSAALAAAMLIIYLLLSVCVRVGGTIATQHVCRHEGPTLWRDVS